MPKRLQRQDKLNILAAVYKRDGDCCWYCGRQLMPLEGLKRFINRKLPANYPTLEHVIPAAIGGSNNTRNMRASCTKCNSQKSHKAVFEHLPTDVAHLHKMIEDIANQLIHQEVSLRERNKQVASLQRELDKRDRENGISR